MSGFSQGEANIWYFGVNAGLDFNSGSPVPLLDGALNTLEGCATISDSSGNLLFYTDGITVYNRNHVQMLNGDRLHGSPSSTHSAIIVPKPNDPNIYYIFTVPSTAAEGFGMEYSEVDMRLDDDLGGITANKNISITGRVTEKIAAVRSSVANEYWVVGHRWGNSDFIAFNVSSTGVDPFPVVSSVGTAVGGFIEPVSSAVGQIKISPDGTKLAVARYIGLNEVQLFDFDASNGTVSNPITLIENYDPNSGTRDDAGPYGIEFSPNSQVLYTGIFDGPIFQYDLMAGSATDIIDSQFTIFDGIQLTGSLQLATDGKIYITKNLGVLDVITNPNELGASSGFALNDVSLGGAQGRFGLPPFIQSFFQPSIVFENTCFGNTTNFLINDPVDTAMWNFDDPASGLANTSTELAPSHVFTAPGVYEVTVDVTLGTETGSLTINVEIFENPTIVQQPYDISICVDSGTTETFDFTDQTNEILGTQDPTVFEVVYSLDPDFITTIPDPTNYTNSTPTEIIYYRISNRGNLQCSEINSFTINVSDAINLPSSITNYEICDDDSDGDDTNGFVDLFLLSTKDEEILDGLDPTNFIVNYFVSEEDAINNVDPIDKTISYQNITANSQTIYVRVSDILASTCIDTSLQFELVVSPLPTVTPVIELRQCDTDTDGFSLFNLNEAGQEISDNYLDETFVFYPTLTDAQNDTNAILNPTTYENITVTSDQVWARTISEAGCFRISEVTLIVSTTGIPASFQRSFTECDDFLDINGENNSANNNLDGITTFDFASVTDEVTALFPPSQQLDINYYRNEADALAEQNPIDNPGAYRNIDYPNTQQIYIRVDSELDNDCLGLGPFITLNVDPVPVANSVSNLELCDDLVDNDGFNGIVQNFDLDSQTGQILGAQDPANFTVTYHLSSDEALNGVNTIINTSAYENIVANQQTIYVRMVNNTTGCFSSQASFDLIVNPLPIANPVPNLEVCDDNSDGSAQNGFAQTFNLQSQTAEVLGGQDPTQFQVTYHASLLDAELGLNPLLTPFSNSIPFSQTIYVRVSNASSGCANGITSFEVIVNPEPTFVNISNLSYCDDDMDGNDTNGIVQKIEFDDQIEEILGEFQPINDFTVTFHASQANATSGNAPLASPYQNSMPNQQTIYVRIVNNATGCVNDDFTFDVVINPLPEFEVITPQILCLNEVPLTLGIENALSIYDYVWEDPTGDLFMGSEIDIRNEGTYEVTATTTDGTNCSRFKQIIINASNIAMISNDDVTIVDDSANNSITIDTTNLGIGDYEFALLGEATGQTNFQDEPFFENLVGDIYTILVRDKNGCGTNGTLSVPVIQFPKFFTPNNDSRNDLWMIKGANSTFFPGSRIQIFDRYGKLVGSIDIDSEGWDGTYNGRVLPSDDYWFVTRILRPDGSLLSERKGNFSLLRK